MINLDTIKDHEALCKASKESLHIPSGPWDQEPHRVEFEAYGFNCLLLRNFTLWNWCGYVGITKDHPLYQLDIFELDDRLKVHGGVTYGELCTNSPFICHIPKEGESSDELFWIGFDCLHSDDIAPGFLAARQLNGYNTENDLLSSFFCSTYKTVDWVKNETTKLARQLRAIQAQG